MVESTGQLLALGRRLSAKRPRRPAWHGHLHGSELTWAVAFLMPYAALFLAFAAYPVVWCLSLGGRPSLYAELVSDPLYLRTLVNTVLYVGLGVNVKMVLALLLSGFFMRRGWWIKAALLVFILPWALPAVPAFLSFHWMLIGERGFLDSALWALFGIDGPIWFNERWSALACNVVAYMWKWLPFWTVVFLAGRMAIPKELYEAAAIDGATGVRRFVHVTLPLLANVYLVSTLLSTVWTLGDFTTVYFVSGGGPALSTEVLATLGIRYAFTIAEPALGVAAALSALPLLLPVVILLMRMLRTREVQL